jgi:hypothetical protein
MADSPTHEASPQEELAAVPAATPSDSPKLPHCGIIMPISDTPGYDAGHWLYVRKLIIRAAKQAGFTAEMVSENAGEDMIHSSIIRNIYHNEIVVCDVSSLNPNVMLELGLRMATKKPIVLVFDRKENFPFDIKNFIYEAYPKDLHIFITEAFVDNLAATLKKVYESSELGTYRPYLSHFSDVTVEASKLDTTTLDITETLQKLVEGMADLRAERSRQQDRGSSGGSSSSSDISGLQFRLERDEQALVEKVVKDFCDERQVPHGHAAMANRWMHEARCHELVKEAYAKFYPDLSPTQVAQRIAMQIDAINKTIREQLTARWPDGGKRPIPGQF